MRNSPLILASHVFVFAASACTAIAAAPSAREISFEKITLTSEYWCDGINAADVNRNGVPDVLTASKLGAFVFITRCK